MGSSQRTYASVRSRNHDLVGELLAHFADGKNARNARLAPIACKNKTKLVYPDCRGDQLIVWRISDKNKYSVRRQFSQFSAFNILDRDRSTTFPFPLISVMIVFQITSIAGLAISRDWSSLFALSALLLE